MFTSGGNAVDNFPPVRPKHGYRSGSGSKKVKWEIPNQQDNNDEYGKTSCGGFKRSLLMRAESA